MQSNDAAFVALVDTRVRIKKYVERLRKERDKEPCDEEPSEELGFKDGPPLKREEARDV